MPSPSRFSARRSNVIPSKAAAPMRVQHDFRGLDMTNPYDLIQKGRTPFAKNFRLYAEDSDSRNITISTRKGSKRFSDVLNLALNVSNTSTSGAAANPVGTILNVRAMPFTPSVSGRLQRVEINVRTGTGVGPLIIEIWSNNGTGGLGSKIADSSLQPAMIGASFSYAPAYFVEAPLVTSGTQYFIVAYIQDDGYGTYEWASNTASSLSLVSNSGTSGMSAAGFSLNYKAYIAPDLADKGSVRFSRINGANVQVAVYGQTMYMINDVTGAFTSVASGLSASASTYNFTYGDGKLMWVNGFDPLTTWDGSTVSTNTEKITNGKFDSDTSSWTSSGGSGNTITRTTSDFNSSPASLSVTATSGQRSANQTLNFRRFQEVQISAYVKGTAGNVVNTFIAGPNVTANSVTLTGSWQQILFTYTPGVTGTSVQFNSTNGNFLLDDVSIIPTGIEKITNPNLPILSIVTMHKDRLFGVSANDPNRIVFSENPGNPSDAADQYGQWYYAWLSVSFIYVPAPQFSDPIVAIVSFQDVLKIFLTNNKYDLYGTDRGSLTLRQSTGRHGGVSQQGVFVDDNYIYFVALDGIYRHNGSSDEIISDFTAKNGGSIQPEFERISFLKNVTVAKWNRQIRFYYNKDGRPYNTDCLLWHTTYEEWQHDTDVYVNRGVAWTDNDDDGRLVETSSLVPTVNNAEQNYDNMGKAIDFAYYASYDSFGAPAQRKRILKYFPLIEGADKAFPISVDMDKDMSNSPIKNTVLLAIEGAKWGAFFWGDGTTWGGDSSFKPVKLRYPGYAYYWQMRLSRRAVNNPVYFFGVQYSYKAKRL